MANLEILTPDLNAQAEFDIAAEVAELEKTPAIRQVEEDMNRVAEEFSVKPQELRVVDLAAEKAKQKSQSSEVVMGQQKLVNGKVIDADGRSVLDKMRMGGNVPASGMAKQMKLESDLTLKGVHVSDKFDFEGRTLITITRVDQKGIVNFTNYEVDPNATLLGGSDFGAFNSFVAGPAHPQTVTDNFENANRQESFFAQTMTAFASAEVTRGIGEPASVESERTVQPEMNQASAEIITSTPEVPNPFSPETGGEAGFEGMMVAGGSSTIFEDAPIVDVRDDIESGIRLIRYQAAANPNLN